MSPLLPPATNTAAACAAPLASAKALNRPTYVPFSRFSLPKAVIGQLMAGLMVREYVICCVTGGTSESLTSTTMLVVVPMAVGVPEITPWFGLAELAKLRPAGRAAEVASRENV